jgi:hypothetical protein
MMSENHLITPPPELLQQWATEYWGKPVEMIHDSKKYIATQAARWGADQELEACVEWLLNSAVDGAKTPEPYIVVDNAETPMPYINALRAARRPKPLSLKEEGLKALDSFEGFTGSLEEVDIIRRALESLPDNQ